MTPVMLRVLVVREGQPYSVDDEWRARVLERLEELGENQSWLASASGCPRSLISDLLKAKRHTTVFLPQIHKALRWPAPIGPLLSKDDQEILGMARGLTAEQLGRAKERLAMMLEETQKAKKRG